MTARPAWDGYPRQPSAASVPGMDGARGAMRTWPPGLAISSRVPVNAAMAMC